MIKRMIFKVGIGSLIFFSGNFTHNKSQIIHNTVLKIQEVEKYS